MPNALIYCRVSTEEQAVKGLSLDAQEKTCRNAAKAAGCNSITVIRDEGKSGGNMNRAGLKKLMSLCQDRKADAIFTIHSDRLARNTENHLMLRRFFHDCNVKLAYVFQPNLSDNTAFGKTMDTVMAAFNEMQRLVISEKTKSALLEKVKEGWFPGVAPIGYINIDNKNPKANEISKRIITIDPERAPLIKEMFSLYATGNFSVLKLVDVMHEKGLRTKRGNKLHVSKAVEILKNPIYVGELHWGGIHIRKANHKPIISRDLFEKVQKIISGRCNHSCRRRKYQFLLRGFLYCSCGRRMTADWHTKRNGKKYAYYHCTRRTGCSQSRYLNKDEAEKQVADQFKTIEFEKSFTKQIYQELLSIYKDHKKKINTKRRRLLNKKLSFEQQRDMLEKKLLSGILSDKDYTRIRSRLDVELDNIEQTLDDIESEQDIKVKELHEVMEFTYNLYKAFTKETSYEIKRRYLSYFWERFEIKNREIVKAVPTVLFRELLELQRVLIRPKMGLRPEIIITELARKLAEKAYADEIVRLHSMLGLFPKSCLVSSN